MLQYKDVGLGRETRDCKQQAKKRTKTKVKTTKMGYKAKGEIDFTKRIESVHITSFSYAFRKLKEFHLCSQLTYISHTQTNTHHTTLSLSSYCSS